MQYILNLGPWHVGPFSTHIGATTFAEQHGCDDYDLIQVDDPAEAPGKIARLRQPLEAVTAKSAL